MTGAGEDGRRLHPATLAGRFLKIVPQTVLGLPALVGIASDADMRLLLLIAAGGAVAALAGALLEWWRFRYFVGAREIVIESGVLNRQRRVIPFDRVQDIDIEQGLLARAFGTAKVRIETGGSTKNEGNLDSVSLAEAHRLRDIIRHGRQQTAAAEGEAPATPAAEPLLFRMDLPRVLLAGIFNFSLVYLAFIFAGFQYLEPLFEWGAIEPDEWTGSAKAAAREVTIGLSLFLLGLILLVGLLVSIGRTVAKDYGFRLTRAPGGLRRRRGLFTLSEVVIPFRRVQLALIRSGFIARQFGWQRLEFQTLSAEAQKSGHQVAAPLGQPDEVRTVLVEAVPAELPSEDAYLRISKRHIARQSLMALCILLIPTIAAAILFPLALGLLAALPLIAGIFALQWRHHRYALTDRLVCIRHGFFTRRLWIVPFENIQSVSVEASWLQRRLGLATVQMDTGGASLLHYPGIVNLRADIARALAPRLLSEHHRVRALIRKRQRDEAAAIRLDPEPASIDYAAGPTTGG